MLDVVFFGWPLTLGGMSVMVGGVDDSVTVAVGTAVQS